MSTAVSPACSATSDEDCNRERCSSKTFVALLAASTADAVLSDSSVVFQAVKKLSMENLPGLLDFPALASCVILVVGVRPDLKGSTKVLIWQTGSLHQRELDYDSTAVGGHISARA